MKRRRTSRSRRTGFTLIEVLLVMVILVILGSFATIYIRGARQQAFDDQARIQIAAFKQALDLYESQIYSYPTTSQGLEALIVPPSDLRNPEKWETPFLDAREIPLDPWDNPYQYELYDEDTPRIWSFGRDGDDGTDDDIGSDY